MLVNHLMSPVHHSERRCSRCQTLGHTKRSCPELRTSATRSSVQIQAVPPQTTSPHVVNLRLPDTRAERWQGIEVYHEPKTPEAERVTVDLAAMVRRANTAPTRLVPESVTPPAVRTMPQSFRNTEQERGNHTQSRFTEFFATMRSWPMAILGRRVTAVALVAALLVSLPFPAFGYYETLKKANSTLVAESTTGFLALQSSTVAALSSNIPAAQNDLTTALNSFGSAQTFLEKDHGILVTVASLLPIIGTQVSSRQALLLAGQHLALGNTYIVKGVSTVQESTSTPLTERLSILRDHLRSAIPQYDEALTNLAHVDPQAIPPEYQESFQEFKLLFAAFIGDMHHAVELVDAMNTVFGNDVEKRYLIMFQNNHELRPTGGFMGSYALLDIQKGKIVNLDVPGGGTYDVQGQLTEYVKPPLPLQLLNGRWEFQDANWFPDFGASAQKIEWFYAHSRSRTVDGVIAVNASVLERLLRVVGPVASDKYGVTLDADTALGTLEEHVEAKDTPEKAAAPKAILGDMMQQFMDKLKDTSSLDAVRLLGELHEALTQKEIQIYMNDDATEQLFRGYGWTGDIAPTAPGQDFLEVNTANIAGAKSDAEVTQTITHEAVVDTDGSIVDTVTVERKHSGDAAVPLYGSPNISYVRLYVPEGAELIDAGGFSYPADASFHVPESWYKTDADLATIESHEHIDVKTGTRITNEFGKTAFGNWVITMPGETSKYYMKYRLPFAAFQVPTTTVPLTLRERILGKTPDTSRYTLVYERQSGITSELESRIIYPDSWQPVWKSNDAMGLAMNGGSVRLDNAGDSVIGLLMEHK